MDEAAGIDGCNSGDYHDVRSHGRGAGHRRLQGRRLPRHSQPWTGRRASTAARAAIATTFAAMAGAPGIDGCNGGDRHDVRSHGRHPAGLTEWFDPHTGHPEG